MWYNPQSIHKMFGVKKIEGLVISKIEPSNRPNKKYKIDVTYNGVSKTIHYGDTRYDHYHDRTPLNLYTDHNDHVRRLNYLKRASKIRNKDGQLTVNDPFSPNRYSVITLW